MVSVAVAGIAGLVFVVWVVTTARLARAERRADELAVARAVRWAAEAEAADAAARFYLRPWQA